MLRLPDELHATLKSEAVQDTRSLNQQIVHILENRIRLPVYELAGGKAVGSAPACQNLASGYQPEANHNPLMRSEP